MTQTSRLPVTAVMVIYNEEKRIERSLRSFADLVDEIIVVHDGPCTDRSLEIVGDYGGKIFVVDHAGEAEHHRPLTYQKASNDWILEIDADEHLSPELRESLPSLIGSGAALFSIAWPTVHAGRRFARGYKHSLFDRRKVYLIGATHEFVKPLDDRTVKRVVESPILHEPGYDDLSWSVFRKKWIPRSRIHASELAADFATIPKWNYSGNDWDYPTNLQRRRPFLVGMITTPLFHWKAGAKRFAQERSWFFFKYGFFTGLYYGCLYWRFIRQRNVRP